MPGNHRAPAAPKGYAWTSLWGCCDCGKHAAMDVDSTITCPECYHLRCQDCPVQSFRRRRVHDGFGSQLRGPPGLPPGYVMPPPKVESWSLGNRLIQEEIVYFHTLPRDHSTLPGSTLRGPGKDVLALPNFNRDGDALSSPLSGESPATVVPSSILSPPVSAGSTAAGQSALTPMSPESSTMSQVFTPQQLSPSSNTDLDSVDINSESDDESGDEDEINYEDHALSVLGSRLQAILSEDLNLVAAVIPKVFYATKAALKRLQAEGIRDVPSSGGSSENHTTQGNSNVGSSSQPSSSSSMTSSSHQSSNMPASWNPPSRKRSRSLEEPNRPNKLPRGGYNPPQPLSEERVLRFACHYHKRYPTVYDPRVNDCYLTCLAPKVPVGKFWRLRDHFETTHGPLYCASCYAGFKKGSMLIDHCSSQSCTPRSPRIFEGIPYAKWIKVDGFIKAKWGLKGDAKDRHEYDRWYDIWEELFPSAPWRPSHPFTELPQGRAPQLEDVETLTANLDRQVNNLISQGVLQQNDGIYEIYRNEVRQTISNYLREISGVVPSPESAEEQTDQRPDFVPFSNWEDQEQIAGIFPDADVVDGREGVHTESTDSASIDPQNFMGLERYPEHDELFGHLQPPPSPTFLELPAETGMQNEATSSNSQSTEESYLLFNNVEGNDTASNELDFNDDIFENLDRLEYDAYLGFQ